MNSKPEIREVPGFPGYFVDPEGRVYSSRRNKSTRDLRVLKPGKDAFGYVQYGLVRDLKARTMRCHRIVAMAFLPPPPTPAHNIRHIDGNPKNNAVTNLAWGTQAENIADKARHGTLATGDRNGRRKHPQSYPVGSKMPVARLNESDVVEVRRLRNTGKTYLDIANAFGVAKSTVAAVIVGKNWRHVK